MVPGPYANNNQVKTLTTSKKTIISISANGYSDEKKIYSDWNNYWDDCDCDCGISLAIHCFATEAKMASRFKTFSEDEI